MKRRRRKSSHLEINKRKIRTIFIKILSVLRSGDHSRVTERGKRNKIFLVCASFEKKINFLIYLIPTKFFKNIKKF